MLSFYFKMRKILYQHFRFGLILCYRTTVPIKKDEEIFFDYHYPLETAPKWYRNHYSKYKKRKIIKGE